MTYLFLDDVRMPQDVGNYMVPVDLRPMYNKENWEIVRNYDDFVAWILENGLPDVVSFDHDLAEAHYDPATWTESFQYLDKTGYDCAKWLVDFCLHEHLSLPTYYVHSMNPVGKQNIICYLEEHSGIDETMFPIHAVPWSKDKLRRVKKFAAELRYGNKTQRMVKRLKSI